MNGVMIRNNSKQYPGARIFSLESNSKKFFGEFGYLPVN